ncbi:MAG: trypsin-like peptidase domain-containing protein [Chloroflexi bacterium]|nr:trypsin-like peptidase domain-containing protein [Chloroflexota bacterium]MDA1145656.1 trypsin-like peptidase domain-containing protein [Chloroflexota bacterium]
MTDRTSGHLVRFAAVAALLLAISGIRDHSLALASNVHVIQVAVDDVAPDLASPLVATEGGVVAESTAPAGVPVPSGIATAAQSLDLPPAELIERAIVHVQTAQSAGSGFVVAGSRVVTNAHVIGSATTATIWFSNGARRDGTVVARSDELDLAVLSVPRIPISAGSLELADPTAPAAMGSAVWAWGYPFEADVVAAGFSRAPTISAGIVSARRVRNSVAYIQTDAAVNPGSSGGPLLDANARVIGINTLVLTPGGKDAEGLNFALDVAAHIDALLFLIAPEAER